MGLLSGLNGLGLGGLDGMSLYEEPERNAVPDKNEQNKKPEQTEIKESDFLFEKGYKCPVCDKEFKVLAIRTGKAKLKGTEMNLRPKYEHIEPLKYDVVMCPHCGFASLTRYWGNVTDMQRKSIRANISRAFKPKKYGTVVYTYDEALERYQMALANALVKQARASEKAYICLKAGWLLRSEEEELNTEDPDYKTKKKMLSEQGDEYLKNALEGFLNARRSENFPICGMDENTVDYLLASLHVEFKEYDQAARYISNLITSRSANSRMKDKARVLKEIIIKETKG